MLHPKPWSRLAWVLPLISIAALGVREHQALAAVTIEWSDFSKADSIYFAPTISEQERAAFREVLGAARTRVAALYGTLRGEPTIIVADAHTLPRFTDGSTAVTHYAPTGAAMVFGPAGQNIDVVAHELAHAELFARTGYKNIEWCVPTWFDEGLAVHFDERPFYSTGEFTRQVEAGRRMPPFDELSSHAQFFAGTREQVRFHYAGARYAIGKWLQKKGKTAATRVLETIECGEPWRAELARISADLE
ncbi:MAG: hypothetical protein RLZZ450_5534 [Pseudomonadota bacterium]|jgi:hypothetical protein